jgi:hypothetical protein
MLKPLPINDKDMNERPSRINFYLKTSKKEKGKRKMICKIFFPNGRCRSGCVSAVPLANSFVLLLTPVCCRVFKCQAVLCGLTFTNNELSVIKQGRL